MVECLNVDHSLLEFSASTNFNGDGIVCGEGGEKAFGNASALEWLRTESCIYKVYLFYSNNI